MDSGYILKVELTGFPDGLDVAAREEVTQGLLHDFEPEQQEIWSCQQLR